MIHMRKFICGKFRDKRKAYKQSPYAKYFSYKIEMQYCKKHVKCLKDINKITSINLQLSTIGNVSFDNQALPPLKIRPPNITLSQETLLITLHYVFLIVNNQCNVMMIAEQFLETRRCIRLMKFSYKVLYRDLF